MRHSLYALLGLIVSAGAANAAPLPSIDMCAVDSSGYAEDLNDNGFVAQLPERIAAGTVVCDHQTMERLGTFGGRSYGLWEAWFTGQGDKDYLQGNVAQIGELDPDGTFRIVYRSSQIDSSDPMRARLVETDGALILAVTLPSEWLWVREAKGFIPINQALYQLPAATVDAALEKGEVPPAIEDGETSPMVGAHFNLDEFAMDVPIAMADEIFPRTVPNPDYDRPLIKRFPLHFRDGKLVAEGGETVVSDTDTAAGIGETPASVVVPKDVAACTNYAFVSDADPAGVAVRAAPASDAQAIANLPGANPADADTLGAELTIVGEKNGWFLIENATHPAELYGAGDSGAVAPLGIGADGARVAYRGRGWIHGSRLALYIQSGESLRASADPKSKPVFDLKISDDGESFVNVTGLKHCKGDALELDVTRSDGTRGSGWIGGADDHAVLCSAQVEECS